MCKHEVTIMPNHPKNCTCVKKDMKTKSKPESYAETDTEYTLDTIIYTNPFHFN